jgi:alpha-glucosidase (family GH31 glycosyl hydrolase)
MGFFIQQFLEQRNFGKGGAILVAPLFQNRANWIQGPLPCRLVAGQWIDFSGML